MQGAAQASIVMQSLSDTAEASDTANSWHNLMLPTQQVVAACAAQRDLFHAQHCDTAGGLNTHCHLHGQMRRHAVLHHKSKTIKGQVIALFCTIARKNNKSQSYRAS